MMTNELINLILFYITIGMFNIFQGFEQLKRERYKLASGSFFIAGMAAGAIITKLLV